MQVWRRIFSTASAVVVGFGPMALGGQTTHHAQLMAQLGHSSDVKAAALSVDGKLVLTGGDDGSARLWEVASGRELRRFYGPKYGIRSVAISTDGRFVLTGGFDAQLWDAATGSELRRFKGDFGPVDTVSFSFDGGLVLTGGGRTAVLWDAPTGTEVRRFETVPGKVVSAGLSRDNRTVLTGGGKKISLWNAATGKQLWQFVSRSESFRSVALSPDGRSVVAGGDGENAAGAAPGVVVLLDASSGSVLRSFKGGDFTVNSVGFSSDSKRVVTGGNDWTARVWDAGTGRELQRLDEGLYVDAVGLSMDGGFVLAASHKRATLWSVASGEPVRQFEGEAEPIEEVSISPDERYLLTGGARDAEQLWDLRSGKLLQWFESGFPKTAWTVGPGPNGVYQLHLRDRDAVPIAADGFDATKTDWREPPAVRGLRAGEDSDDDDPDVYSPEREATRAANPPPRGVSFIPSFRCGSDDPHTAMGELQKNVGGPLVFSADCRWAAFGSADGTTVFWDVATGKELAALISFRDGGWAVVDLEGRFDTSDLDGGAPLQWVVDDDPMRALPLEIFMRDYYTPGLLVRVLKGETLPPIQSIAEIKNRVQPDVTVVSVTPSAAMRGRVDVVVHAASHTDEKKQVSGLKDLRLFRDGQMVAGGYLEGKLVDKDYVFRDVMLKSDAKKVTFTAYAFNSERIKSATASRDYEPKPPLVASVRKPHAYLLQIGVNHFAATGCDLRFSVNDAETMSAVLKQRLEARGMVVEAVVLESVKGGDAMGASKERIHAELVKIAAKATPDDAFFMSFSGHGVSSEGMFYIMPSDIVGSCEHPRAELLKNAISADTLAEWLRAIDAGEMTFVLDACRSASSVESEGFKAGPLGSRGLGQLAYDKRMRILAASQANEAAGEYESLHQGLLSYVLTQDGLVRGEADWQPVDHQIKVGEWLAFAVDKVPKFVPGETQDDAQKSAANQEPLQTPALFNFSKRDTFVLQ
jgi:WD40 repeat protein